MEVAVETKRLLSMFRAVGLSGLIPKVKLHFNPDGVSALNPGTGKQIMSRVWFSKDFFINYDVSESTTVTLNCDQVVSLLKVVKDNKVTLTVDSNYVYIKGNSVDVRVPQVVIDEESIPVELFEAPFGEIVVKKRDTEEETKQVAEEFLKLYCYTKIPILPGSQLDPLKVDKITFEVRDGRLFMIQENEVGVRFGRNISEMVNNAKDGVRVTVRTEFIKEAMKSFLSGEVYIAIGQKENGWPLAVILCDKTTDWRITVPIAPRVEEISEEEE